MPKSRPPYPPEFRERVVELMKAGRSGKSLAREFGCTEQSIRNWKKQLEGSGSGAPSSNGESRPAPRASSAASDERAELERLRREVRVLREERDIPKKSCGLVRAGVRGDAQAAYRLVKANQAVHDITTLCRVLEVSESGYHAWRTRLPSKRAVADEGLSERIRAIHAMSDGTYGVPRIHAELAAEGVHIGRKRVARLMRAARIEGVSRRRWCVTTTRDERARPAPDLVDRKFVAPGPDQLWVADITYIPTHAGFLYLAVVLDAWSRKIVGWAMAGHLKTQLVVQALDMAVGQRQPQSVVHHSDQGTQYTSIGFGLRCKEAGVRPSMGSVGDAYDNAMCESFFATLECELLARRRFTSHAEARMAVFRFIEGWYNPLRRHSALDYESPAGYEKKHRAAA
ncbi:IS3 family transposase [Myxococcus qinghaiensis]|uniref:IS3 family transposase n=1 Tax=Myxococcus qinghaiensis TaxID=2906758 RepID=UPI0020A720F8|nr:IS3 family transposase [Myxococcus qinghaiensis]MCP3166843.1 IS3 family transposase [Myxococcus qinghaiensis]